MVCCVTLAALFGLILRPMLGWGASPLAWRPAVQSTRARNRLASFGHAFAGIGFLVRNEANMRIHLGVAAAVIIAGVWFRIDPAGWRWLVIAMALVPVAEALNTGVEQACNAVTRERRPEIKAAKDVAAAGVLIAAIAAALIGASVFVPALIELSVAPPICGGEF
ncbi:undecaprenol kinase/diacylglycerol kinase (ATP) [Novosphingobium sp. CF614]|nr:undecaprenol kinase/diacylglycerol kinase (ATP) [Novosphingobium sp. CF614]